MNGAGPRRLDPPSQGMSGLLQIAAVAALILAGLGAALPDVSWLSGAAIGVIVATPLVRVALLAVRWFRQHDRRFAGAAIGLLGVVAAGALLATF